MVGYSFPCPWCSAPLRVKDRALAGRVTACPDCRRAIQLVENDSEELTILRAGLTDQKEVPASTPAAARSRKAGERRSRPSRESSSQGRSASSIGRPFGRERIAAVVRQSGRLLEWLRDPLVLSWTMAGIFTAVMLFLIIPRGREEQGELILETPAWQPDTNLTQTARDEEPASDSDVPVGPILLDPEPIESSGGEQPETQVSESARPPVMAERPAQPFATVQPVVAVRPISVETEVKVPITSEPPEFDIAAALKQPLRRYELSTPVPLEDLLPELEELVGAPIYGDAETIPDLADRLAKRVKLQLDDTTVGDVLRALLRQADLEMEIQANSLQFRAVTSENEGLQP